MVVVVVAWPPAQAALTPPAPTQPRPMNYYCPDCGSRADVGGGCRKDNQRMVPRQPGALLGEQIGRYTLVARLGSGGMGEVYKAVHIDIGSKAAFKVLHATGTPDDAQSAQRLLLEAQLINRIDHDGVVKVTDAGYLAGGRAYLVMEYLDGESLGDVVARGQRLPLGTACQVVIDVLDVLAAAHAQDVIHRDLKPPNVFLTRTGRTVILDFGVAKLLDPASGVRLTATGAIVGTPHYMAPEQIRSSVIDARADLYSTGVMLFELVTGRRPYEAEAPFDVLAMHLEHPIPSARAILPEVPVAVDAVIETAMAKDPGRRFGSAQAMKTALSQAILGLPTAAFTPIDLSQVRGAPRMTAARSAVRAGASMAGPQAAPPTHASPAPPSRWPIVLVALITLAAGIGIGLVLR